MRKPVAIAFALAVAAFFFVPTDGQTAGHRFFASLRIAKPKAVAAGVAAVPTRTLPATIGSMLADSVTVSRDEPEQPAPDAAAAGKLAGFTARLPARRADRATFSVLGVHEVRVVINPAQLRTTFIQAGLGRAPAPASLAGATVAFTTPRAIRAQYGKCPEPVANTIQAQIQGPPPPSTDYGTCLVVTQTPATTATLPNGVDMAKLVDIAVQLSGMSPNQAQSFQVRFDWHTALSMSLPRSMRSYDTVDVAGAKGMLFNTASRRGPTYTLIWARDGTVYALAGYGSSADALPLATSIR